MVRIRSQDKRQDVGLYAAVGIAEGREGGGDQILMDFPTELGRKNTMRHS